MTEVNAASSVSAPSASGAPATASPTAPSSLLSEPSPAALPSSDPLSMLCYFESNDQALTTDDSARRVQELQTERQQAMQQSQQQVLQQLQAQNQHSFWDDVGSVFGEVAKVASVVVSVAAAVASFGTATPLAVLAISGAVLSAAAFTDGEFHVLKSLGVRDDLANAIDTGLSIGGSLLSGAVGTVGNAGSVVQSVGLVAEGASEVGAGAATIGAGEAQARADRAEADSIVDQTRSDQAQRFTQTTLDDLRVSDQASQHIMQAIATTAGIRNDTTELAANAVRG